MHNLTWQDDLNRLLARFPGLVLVDTCDMDLTQLRRLYRGLRRLIGGQQ